MIVYKNAIFLMKICTNSVANVSTFDNWTFTFVHLTDNYFVTPFHSAILHFKVQFFDKLTDFFS